MLFEEIKNIKSGKKELRQFGIISGIIFGLWGGLFLILQKDFYLIFFILSVVFIALGSFAPRLLLPIQKVCSALIIFFIGWLLTKIVLFVLFYFVVTPIGILAKMFGGNFLSPKLKRNADSYWITRAPIAFDRRNYEHQF